MPSANPVVYNNANLFSWKEEYPLNEQKILENSSLIEEQRSSLKPFQDQLSSLDVLISSARNQISIANVSANQDMMYHMDSHHHRHHHGNGALHFMGDVMRASAIASLQSELDRLHVQRGRLLSQMQPLEDRINKAQAKRTELRSRQAWLQEHMPAAELFLQMLAANPAKSVDDLVSRLAAAFTAYEDNHLMKLSPQVRISLMVVRYKLNELFDNHAGYAPEYSNQIHQKNYLRLCGFIWDMYQRVKQENKDSEFAKLLGSLVESTHVLQTGDLPDSMQTGYSASVWFAENKQKLPRVFAIQEWDLATIEEDVFNNEVFINTQRGYFHPTSLQLHVTNAISLIDAEVQMKKKKHEEIDYHFYGRAVRVLNDVFANPLDKLAAKRLGDIAEHASGSRSVGKQVLGGFVIVLGVLLIGASIVGFAATFGSSSILSAWSFALGLNLMQGEIAVATTSSVVAATGIGLTFFAGPSTIKSGQRQGLSQELMSVKKGIENYDGLPPITAPFMPSAPPMPW